jgi:hypothetical protein
LSVFFGVRPLIIPFYIQTLLVCPSSVYVPWLLLCIFKFLLYVLLRCVEPEYSHCIFKIVLSVLPRCTAPDYSFCIFKLLLSVFLRCTNLSTPVVSSDS